MAKRKISENSLKNLEKRKSFSKNSVDFALKCQKKSVEKRKENQTLAELMKVELSMPDEDTGDTNNIAITKAMINKAKKGDVSAYQTIRDTIGEKPIEKQEVKNLNPQLTTINILPVKSKDES